VLGAPVAELRLDAATHMLLRTAPPGGETVNATATALLGRYPEAVRDDPVRGGVLLTGARGDGTDADAPL
jgi:hypothetical protein